MKLNQAVFLGRAKPWPNFLGIMQNCIGISMSLTPGPLGGQEVPENGFIFTPRYSIFSGDHGLLVFICFFVMSQMNTGAALRRFIRPCFYKKHLIGDFL